MAYDRPSKVRRDLVTAWRKIMPVDPATSARVPVDYTWPGQYQKPLHVWFLRARRESEPGSMGRSPSGLSRRDQRTSLQFVVECRLTDKVTNDDGVNVLQEQADAKVEQIVGLIDEWISKNPTLGQTTSADVPVDYGVFDVMETEQGLLEHAGVASRALCTITYRIRPR